MELNKLNLGKVAITVEQNPWDINRAYDALTIVDSGAYTTYISRIPVPRKTLLTDRKYWMPFSSRTAIAVSAFSILADEQSLPTTEDTYAGPYLIGDDGYFWVGTGGNKLNGKYKSITLKGDTGADGKSAFEIYRANGGPIDNEADWLASLSITGPTGKSAYELYVAQCTQNGITPKNLEGWLASLQGVPGKSAYDIYVDQCTALGVEPFTKDVWLISLKGQDGMDGNDGSTPYIGTNGNWFIDGRDTRQPSRGANGQNGQDGKDGQDGHSPVVTIGADGFWYIDGVKTEHSAMGVQGPPGDSVGVATDIVVTNDEIKIFTNYDPSAGATIDTSVHSIMLQNTNPVSINIIGSHLTSPVTIKLTGANASCFDLLHDDIDRETNILTVTPNIVTQAISLAVSVRRNSVFNTSARLVCTLAISSPDLDEDVLVYIIYSRAVTPRSDSNTNNNDTNISPNPLINA